MSFVIPSFQGFVKPPIILTIQGYRVDDIIALGLTPTRAFSFSLLKSTYNGFCCRIRRNYDNAQVDASFYFAPPMTEAQLDMHSTITVVSGSTNATKLGQFVAASGFFDVDSIGSTTNGYVVTWYDQMGIANFSTSTAADQPQIIVNSAFNLTNGYITPLQPNDWSIANPFGTSIDVSIWHRGAYNYNNSHALICGAIKHEAHFNTNYLRFYADASNYLNIASTYVGTFHSFAQLVNGAGGTHDVNISDTLGNNATYSGSTTFAGNSSAFWLGYWWNTPQYHNELILFDEIITPVCIDILRKGIYVSQLILNNLTNTAKSVYSLRRINGNYKHYVVRIRRGYDNAIADVAFDTNDAFSLNSKIKLVSGSTNAKKLGEFVAASGYTDVDSIGSGDSAYVVILYDQNLFADLKQTIESNQPRIINSGALEVKNSKPSIFFDNSTDAQLDTDTFSARTPSSTTVYSVMSMESGIDNYGQIYNSGASSVIKDSGLMKWRAYNGDNEFAVAPATQLSSYGGLYRFAHYVLTSASCGFNIYGPERSETRYSGSDSGISYTSNRIGGTSGKFYLSELIVFETDLTGTADDIALKNDTATYYGITI